MTDSKDLHTTQRTFKADFHAGLDAGIGGGGEATKIPRPELLVDPGFLRSRAEKLVHDLSSTAVEIKPGRAVGVGEWCVIGGRCRVVHVFHDDFREDPDAPSVVAWLLEVPDLNASSVSWFVLHGTPEGNEVERVTTAMPATRSGSGTEALFEVLYAAAYEGQLKEIRRRARDYEGEALALAVASLFNDYSSFRSEIVEALFRVTQVLAPGSTEPGADNTVTSIVGLTSGSKYGEVTVSRVVIGGPLLVQTLSEKVTRPSLLGRWWDRLRGRSRTERFDLESQTGRLPSAINGPNQIES